MRMKIGTQNFVILFSVAMLAFSGRASASDAPDALELRSDAATNQRVGASLTSLQTSTGYRTTELALSYLTPASNSLTAGTDKNKFDLGINSRLLDGQTDGVHFRFETLELQSTRYFEKTKIEFGLGVMNRMDDLDAAAQTLIAHIAVMQAFGQGFASLELGHGVFADTLQSEGSTRGFLQGPYVGATWSVRPAKRWRATLIEHLTFLSDDNRRSDSDASLMYGISA